MYNDVNIHVGIKITCTCSFTFQDFFKYYQIIKYIGHVLKVVDNLISCLEKYELLVTCVKCFKITRKKTQNSKNQDVFTVPKKTLQKKHKRICNKMAADLLTCVAFLTNYVNITRKQTDNTTEAQGR